MSEHGRFLIALSELDVPRVRQLVATALKAGRSISYIVDKLFDAANGLYRPKGYDDKELDLSFLILKVGLLLPPPCCSQASSLMEGARAIPGHFAASPQAQWRLLQLPSPPLPPSALSKGASYALR